MFKLVPFLAALSIAAPALADTPIKFERNGINYVGIVHEQDGVRFIRGYEVGSNRAFALRVANGRVTGTYDGDEVAYPEPVRLIASR